MKSKSTLAKIHLQSIGGTQLHNFEGGVAIPRVSTFTVFKSIILAITLLIANLFFTNQSFAQSPYTYITNGTFTVPAGVSTVTVQAWGGGGAGGGCTSTSRSTGGGGAGGTFTQSIVSVPLASYAVTVGLGGTGNSAASGASGGTSSFGTLVTAVGGGGGGVNVGTSPLNGPGAGVAAGTTHSGGAGGTGNATTGSSGTSGGGGGGAGSVTNGGSSAGTTAGSGGTPEGGIGAAGTGSSGGGIDALALSGGGSGGRNGSSSVAAQIGGDGFRGQVIVTWSCPTYALTSAASATSICGSGTSTVTLTSSTLPAGTYAVTYTTTSPGGSQTAPMTFSGGTGTFTTISLSANNTITVTNLSSGTAPTNCSNAISLNNVATVTVTALPTVTYTTQPGASACIGVDVTYTTQESMTGYVWGFPGTLGTDYSITSGGTGTNNTVTLKYLTTGPKTVTINYTSGGCTAASATSSTATTVNALPTVTYTAQPGASACIGVDVIYTTQASMTGYVWGFPGTLGTDYSITSGGTGTNNTVTLKYLTTGPKTVTINYTSGGCTAASATSSTATTVNALPTVTYTTQPGASACIGVDVIYTTQASMTGYVWGFPGTLGTDYSITSGGAGTNNTVTLKYLTAGPKTVTINYTSGGCSAASATSSTTTTVNALPTVTYTAQPGASACLGVDVTYTTQASMTGYVWGFPGTLGTDYSITSGGTGTNNTVTLKYLTTGPKTVTINYTSGGCTAASATSSTATTVNALPTVTYTTQPGASACLGVDVTYTTQASMTGYVWGFPGTLGTDYSITSGGAGTNNTVTLKYLTAGPKTVTINYTSGGCSAASATSSTTTTVNALPTVTYTAQPGASACIGVDVIYTTQASMTGYVWGFPGTLGTDYSITSGGTGTNNTVTLKYLTAGPRSVNINYTSGGCTAASATSSATTTVNAIPTVTYTAQPGASACQGVDVIYTTQASMTSYVWGFPGTLGTDYSITSGGAGTNNTATLKYLTAGPKTVTINYTSGGCTAASATSSTTTTVNALPTVTYTAQPGASACIGADVTYATQASMTSYVWGFPGTLGTDYSITSGGAGTNNNVTLKYLTAGSKTVTINYTSGSCTAASATSSITTNVSALPAIDLTVGGTGSVCSGSGTNITIAASESGVNYQLRNNNANEPIGSVVPGNGGLINLPTGNLTATTTFNVLATLGSCLAQLTETEVVTISTSPAVGLVVGGTGSVCSGSGTNITVAGSVVGTNYQLRNDNANELVGSVVPGNGLTINLPTGNLTATTTFNVLATLGSCTAELTETEVVTISPLPAVGLTVGGTGTINSGTGTTITVAASVVGTNYQLRNDNANELVGSVVAGDGGTIYLPTGTLTTTTIFNVLATLGSCPAQLTGTAVVTVSTASGIDDLQDNSGMILRNHPNPFTGNTTISYTLPFDGRVTLTLRNITGQLIKTIINEMETEGDYTLNIEVGDLQSGVYLATLSLKSNGKELVKTIRLVKGK